MYFHSIFSIQNHPLLGAFCYSFTMNSKHLFCFQAPFFLVYLLRTYCFSSNQFHFTRFLQLGVIVLSSRCSFLLSFSLLRLVGSNSSRKHSSEFEAIPLSFIPLPARSHSQLLGCKWMGFVCRIGQAPHVASSPRMAATCHSF